MSWWRPMSWQEQAKCTGADTEWFYPPRDENYGRYVKKARSICLDSPRCPVIRECLLYSLVMPDQHGVWGGMSSRERKALYKRRVLPDYVTRADLVRLGLADGSEELTEEAPGHEEETYDPAGSTGAPPAVPASVGSVHDGPASERDLQDELVPKRKLVLVAGGAEAPRGPIVPNGVRILRRTRHPQEVAGVG